MKIQPSRKGDIYVQKNLRIQIIHITHLHIQGNNRVIGVRDFAKIINNYTKMLLNISLFCLNLKMYSKSSGVLILLEELEK